MFGGKQSCTAPFLAACVKSRDLDLRPRIFWIDPSKSRANAPDHIPVVIRNDSSIHEQVFDRSHFISQVAFLAVCRVDRHGEAHRPVKAFLYSFQSPELLFVPDLVSAGRYDLRPAAPQVKDL